MNHFREKFWILPAALVLALVLAGCGRVTINGASYPLSARELDLSGAPLQNPEELLRLEKLELLDIREAGVDAQTYLALQETLPGCRILWELPLQGKTYPLDTRELEISSLTQEEARSLALLPQLETVNAQGCRDYDALMTLRQTLPSCRIHYTLELAGQTVPEDRTALVLWDASQEDLNKLTYLPLLETVRFMGKLPPADRLLTLEEEYPQVSFSWYLEEANAPWDARELTLPEDTALEALEQLLPYLPRLESLNLGTTPIPAEALFSLEEQYPGLTIFFHMSILGVSTDRDARELDLSGIPVTDLAALEKELSRLPRLEKVIMAGCGVSNEEMDALNQRYPQIQFVWSVKIGLYGSLRTDATYFMPYQMGLEVTSKDLTELKYCRDLVVIDVGHMKVSDCEFAAYMPNLEYLILADTEVTSLEPLRGLENLIFLEVFMCPVTDYRPLWECPNLQDLNIVHNPQGMVGLEKLTWLKRLWLRPMDTVEPECEELLARLREALPDTQVVYSGEATGHGWRDHQNYRDMRDILGMWYLP